MVEISDYELESISRAIRAKFGLDFTNYEPNSLKRGYARLIIKFNLDSLLGLWKKIMNEKSLIPEWMDELTVGLTEMFRNPEAWQFIRNEVLTKYKDKDSIKIWHAGCSSGEEIHSMAILLHESGMLPKARALASDLSNKALETAKKGIYSSMLFERYKNSYQTFNPMGRFSQYFNFNDDMAVFKKELSKHVSFANHNLVNQEMNEKFDIIFCRNVMIYFDDTLKLKVLGKFYDALKDDGFFIIGYYDLVPKESENYFTSITSSYKVYTKATKGAGVLTPG